MKKDPNTGDRSNIIIYRNKKNVTGSLYSGGFATRHGYKFYIIYKSLFTEKTVATQKHSSASINTNKVKTTTKSITAVDTCYWSINKISYIIIFLDQT